MRLSSFIIFAAIASSIIQLSAQVDPLSADINVLLDIHHPEATKLAIVEAVEHDRIDALFKVMHNQRDDLRQFCLDHIGTASKQAQARLLANILLDDNLIPRKDEASNGNAEIFSRQNELRKRVEKMSHSLLGDDHVSLNDTATRAGATSLANRLLAVKS